MNRTGRSATLLSFLLICALSTSALANVPSDDVTYQPPSPPEGGISVWFSDANYLNRAPTQLIGVDKKGGSNLCSTIASGECAEMESVNYSAQLPQCRNADSLDCVKELFATDGAGKRIDATFLRQVPSTVANPYTADLTKGLVAGEASTVWRLPGVSPITDEFAVVSFKTADARKDGATGRLGNFGFGELQIAIYPVVKLSNPGYKVNKVFTRDINGDGIKDYDLVYDSQVPTIGCALVDNGECYMRKSFPDGYTFGATVRLSQSPLGWVHGRMKDPTVSLKKVGSAFELGVIAGAVDVPELGGSATANQIVPGLLMRNDRVGGVAAPSPSGDESIRVMRLWLGILGDKAVALPRQWFFRTLKTSELQGADQCIANYQGLAGFVTTNSTTYSAGPPVFNKSTQSLDYQVAAPHLQPDGKTVFKGTYSLVMRTDVARCIYKFSNAPIKATVSIVKDASEELAVATEAIQDKDGWFSLSANGFTFSSPTLRVKLSQDQPITAVPEPNKGNSSSATVPAAKSPARTTITCKKGKLTRKVSGTAPKCPAGFKRA